MSACPQPEGCEGFKLPQFTPQSFGNFQSRLISRFPKAFLSPQKMPENFRKILTPESSDPKAEGCVTWRWKEEVDKKLRVASVWHQLFYWERPGYVHRTVTSFNSDEFARSPLVDDGRLLPQKLRILQNSEICGYFVASTVRVLRAYSSFDRL